MNYIFCLLCFQQTSAGEERLRMCVAVKKKLQLYYWKDREFHELQVKCKMFEVWLTAVWSRFRVLFVFQSFDTFNHLNIFFLSVRGTLVHQTFQSPWLGVKTPYVLVSSETITSFGYVLQQRLTPCFSHSSLLICSVFLIVREAYKVSNHPLKPPLQHSSLLHFPSLCSVFSQLSYFFQILQKTQHKSQFSVVDVQPCGLAFTLSWLLIKNILQVPFKSWGSVL